MGCACTGAVRRLIGGGESERECDSSYESHSDENDSADADESSVSALVPSALLLAPVYAVL